jgi:hypothetical protein
MTAVGAFAQDGLVFAKFGEDFRAFAAELVRIGFDCLDERFQRVKAVFGAIPLRGRKALEQIGIASAFLDEERHGIFVGGEEFEERFHPQLESKLFDGALVTREHTTVHVDVVARVFALDHDIHRGCHWVECSAGRVVD